MPGFKRYALKPLKFGITQQNLFQKIQKIK